MKPKINKIGQKIINDPNLSIPLMESIDKFSKNLFSGHPIFFGKDNEYKVTLVKNIPLWIHNY